MKILFYRYGSICEPDLMDEFAKLGLDVDTIDVETEKKCITDSERIDLVNAKASTGEYLFLFTINFYPVLSNFCNIINLPYVCWVVDAPVPELFDPAIKNPCNKVFCFDRKEAEEASLASSGNVYHLPLGTNAARWDKTLERITAEDIKKYSSDISFVGSLYTEKDPLSGTAPSDYFKGFSDALYSCQKDLQGLNLIHGAINPAVLSEIKRLAPDHFKVGEYLINMDEYIATRRILDFHFASLDRLNILGELSDHFPVDVYTRSDSLNLLNKHPGLKLHDGVTTHVEMPRIFRLSKINLNITIRAIETGASLRIWDILGCGGFLISNYQEELCELLVPGEDFDYYSDLGDLKEKCAFYLAHEDIRQSIALSGYEKVRKYHTYTNRMPEIFKKILG
ncbi:MAG: DUF3880 domain-containing protein [Lachnospiraceae bacterium]|nr:DUF3880 domain-containing protein [Lachnospiraceae bacterium]